MNYFTTSELKNFTQQIVEAMCAVLNMQITIVDQSACRVAGTGCFSTSIGKELPKDYLFQKVVSTGESYFIDNPKQSAHCKGCAIRNSCKELTTLLVPIKLNEEIIGGIGIAAMTTKERNELINNENSYFLFMNKMSELLSAKVKGDLDSAKNLLLADDLNSIIESYPYGIITIDSNCTVLNFNGNAEKILNIATKNVIGKKYSDIISCDLLNRALLYSESFQSVKATFKISNTFDKEVILSVQSAHEGSEHRKIVCFFQGYYKNSTTLPIVKESITQSFSNIQGQSLELMKVINFIKKISASSSTVLITGESGTGKEIFAKSIHHESSRAANPFVAINCSAIPDNLLESELFGYSKGAFTSANTAGKIGRFELADKGTIFLDEIGDMPINLQAKLLRVLQEKKIERLGSTNSIDIDIRIIAATNKNLKELIAAKLFREDLYYRINVIPIHLPPLRDRHGDVALLAKFFFDKHISLLSKSIKGFLPETLSILNNYNWPGNIRELENVIEFAVNMENGEFIQPSSLPNDLLAYNSKPIPTINTYSTPIEPSENSFQTAITNVEKKKMQELFDIYGTSTDSKKIIAEKLNVSLSTLYRKLKKLGY